MRVGFDIGGTFTDVILLAADGRPRVSKVLSLLDRIGEDIAACIDAAPGEAVTGLVHGTTIASNAVIEGTTAPTGLLTTRGFRDELEMRGQRRPNVYDVDWDRLPPLVPRRLRLEVDERVLGDASVERPLDEAGARQAIERLRAAGVEAVAVCLMNAYLNAEHERALGRLLARHAPELVVCLSSDVHPEIREYERTSTTVINASLIPVVNRYLDRLERHLRRFRSPLLIMQSNGGIMAAELARRRPALMIESGPAAGVLAAARLAGECGLDRVLSFDMGGTTAKACLVEGGVPLEKPGGEVGGGATMTTRLFGGAGHALRVPWLDIVEVGAGGGSIAWIDEGGALRAGPQSAGADPGPACYGQGGERPTVTDANVALGYMNPAAIAGDTLRLDRDAALAAIGRAIAEPLGLDVLAAAHGITQVANATMMRALRAVSTERGRDPREFILMPFGGAGPMHAAALADAIGVREVWVPPLPGLFSALGLLMADYRHDYVRSLATDLAGVDPDRLREHFAEMEAAARAEMAEEGVDLGRLRFERQADLRYGYQVSELPVAVSALDAGVAERLAGDFTAAHRLAFGYVRDDPIELVNLRLRALAPAAHARFADLDFASEEAGVAATRAAYFGPAHGVVETPVVRRMALADARTGPLIVEEPDTTVVVPPGWRARLGDARSIVIEREAAPA